MAPVFVLTSSLLMVCLCLHPGPLSTLSGQSQGLRQMRAEFSLSVLAYNLMRVMNVVGVKGLVEACGRLLRALRWTTHRYQDPTG